MGIWSRFNEWLNAPAGVTAEMVTVGGGDILQVSSLPPDVAAAFGINLDSDVVTRKQAMSIPTVRQGRMAVAGTIGTFPLFRQRIGRGGSLERVPSKLLDQPDPNASRAFTMTWLVDDLMFGPVAWWKVLEKGPDKYPSRAERVAPHRVSVDHSRREIRIDGKVVADDEVIRFDGPDEGILQSSPTTLRTALLLEQAVRRYAVMDVPLGLLDDKRTVGDALTDTEIDDLLTRWVANRRSYTTAYLGPNMGYETVQFNAEQLQLTQARQQTSIELARVMNLDAEAVNAPAASGMTYQNGDSRRRARLDMSLRPYMEAIAGRLSMPDVTPAGQQVLFDTAGWLRGDGKEAVDAAVAASGGPVMDTTEARDRYLDMPPMKETTP